MSAVAELSAPTSSSWLVEALLREQQEMPAVARFSQWHEEAPPQQARYYRDLIPLESPGPGEQYAFQVDLDACSGCKACVTACHSLNGLEEQETWRSVGLLHGTAGTSAVLRYVTTACHHCVEPACLLGCPTQAYEKDPVTGIVRHLDDQCFGCQYCVLMCPYDVPKYSAAKGIVRKCDMCRQRLAADEAPACVQACPNQAIAIRVVKTGEAVARAAAGIFLPAAPDPAITCPTTIFNSRDSLVDELVSGDRDDVRPAQAHWPLVFMLVLTQMSLGIVTIGHLLIAWLGWLPAEPGRAIVNATAAVIGLVGANLAVLHLGRPLIAYRAWLGWRTSWLSREVLAFGGFVPFLLLTAVASLSSSSSYVPLLELASVFAGTIAVFCSAMIYIATRRAWWGSQRTFTRFALTVFLLGNATCTAIATLVTPRSESLLHDYRFVLLSMAAAMVVVGWRLAAEASFLQSCSTESDEAIRGTGQLLADRPLRYVVRNKQTWAIAAAFALPLFALWLLVSLPDTDALRVTVAGICFVRVGFTLAAEVAERYLFFAACISPRMPGALSP